MKFHEVLAVILKGVIEGLRTGLATCRFLYIASIGSAPSISLYVPIKEIALLSVVFMVALQAWLARLGNRSTNGSTAFKKRRGVARTLLE
jgi:hypothetical protein